MARRCTALTLHRFRFLDPYRCATANLKSEQSYIEDFILETPPDSFVFLPYHQQYVNYITQLL